MAVRARRFVFTINNYEETDIQNIEEKLRKGAENWNNRSGYLAQNSIEILIAEKEEAPTTGTQHIQGYIEFINTIARTTLEHLLFDKAYIEVAKGSRVSNVKYCTKDAIEDEEKQIIKYFKDEAVQKSTEDKLNSEPKKSADEKAKEILSAIETHTEREFEAEFPNFFLRNYSKYKEHQMLKQQQNAETFNGDLKTKNYWIYGPTGTGKSRCVREDLEYIEIYDKAINKWWNGYDQQRVVIIDDYPSMESGNCLVQYIKRWSDRYPFTAEIKGAHQLICPKNFNLVVTSNFKIEECFKDVQDVYAIKRRFTEIYFDAHAAEQYKNLEDIIHDTEENIRAEEEIQRRENQRRFELSQERERHEQHLNQLYKEGQEIPKPEPPKEIDYSDEESESDSIISE